MRISSTRSLALIATLSAALLASPVHAQRAHVVVIAGLSGDATFRKSFDSAIRAVRTAATSKWGVADSSLIVLTEDSARTPLSSGQSRRETIARTFASLSARVQPGDVLLVLLLGHGSGEGPTSKVNIPGPDATAADYKLWTAPFNAQQVVFVNAATGSGDFVPVLQAPWRVVVTATRSAMERNESVFATHFTTALASDAADADKDGRISVLEAFRYARTEVTKAYESTNRLLTEHAVLSDSLRAASISFGRTSTAVDPRVSALIAERRVLESEVAALRERKTAMNSERYAAELERLLLAIAEKSQAIRAAGGK